MKCEAIPLRVLCCVFVYCLTLSAIAGEALGQVSLSARAGFEDKTMPGRYAPLRIEIKNFRGAGAARLRVVQDVGNLWRGQAEITLELGYAIQSDGVFEAVIPLYDPANPFRVELVSAGDMVLASCELDLRSALNPSPFPILDRNVIRFDEQAAVVDVANLPREWWGLDACSSLWIASPLSAESWESVYQWVISGGTLVFITGTDFFRMDSPVLREMLPIAEPTLLTSPGGLSYLAGTLRRRATVALLHPQGFPLLTQTRFGAGTVSVVTLQARDLSAELLRDVKQKLPVSQLISLQDGTQAALGEWRIATLNPLIALGGMFVLGAVVVGSVALGRRRARVGSWVFVAGIGVVAVSLGLLSNPLTHVIDHYYTNTHLSVKMSFGSYMVCSGIYSRSSRPCVQVHPDTLFPLQELPRTWTTPGEYDMATARGQSTLRIPSGAIRSWRAYGETSVLVDIQEMEAGRLQIVSHEPGELEAGWIVREGRVYPIGEVRPGRTDYHLRPADGIAVGAFLDAPDAARVSPILRDLFDQFPMGEGLWFIGFSDRPRTETMHAAQKVRDLSLLLVRGEEASGAI